MIAIAASIALLTFAGALQDSVLLPPRGISDTAVVNHAYPPRNDTAWMQPASHINHTAIGTITGLAVGATVGVLVGRNKSRSCHEGPCFAAPAFAVEFGLLGALVGGMVGSHWPTATEKALTISSPGRPACAPVVNSALAQTSTPASWSLTQLNAWLRYLTPVIAREASDSTLRVHGLGIVSARNIISVSVGNEPSRAAVARTLDRLALPCNLVEIEIGGPISF